MAMINSPKTITNVILTVLTLALGMMPLELALRLSWSSCCSCWWRNIRCLLLACR